MAVDDNVLSVSLARMFFEQCCGTTCGHMAAIPNNPVLWTLFSAISGTAGSTHAATQSEFSAILRAFADALDEANK